MSTQSRTVGTAAIGLRITQFDRHCKARGLDNAHARAAYIGVHRTSINRIVARDTLPSERFIALTLEAFPELRFEDLFEVVHIEASERAA